MRGMMRGIKTFKEYADHIKINIFGLSRSFSFKRINFYYLIILVMKYRKYIILDKGLALFKKAKLYLKNENFQQFQLK